MARCLLDIGVSHGLFDRYEMYINSEKVKLKTSRGLSRISTYVDTESEIVLTVHRKNILEKWYWFICLFNIFNFFYSFSIHRIYPAFYDFGHVLYKIKLKPEENADKISLDIEIDYKEYGDKDFYKAIKKIDTCKVAQLKCYRKPAMSNYKNRWRSSNIFSVAIYVAASYVFAMMKMINGEITAYTGWIVYAVVSFSLCVFLTISVFKSKSVFDVIKTPETVWEKKDEK